MFSLKGQQEDTRKKEEKSRWMINKRYGAVGVKERGERRCHMETHVYRYIYREKERVVTERQSEGIKSS